MDDEHKRKIYLLGAHNLSNQFLCYTITHELDIPVIIYSASLDDFSSEAQSPPAESNSHQYLFLLDSSSISIDEFFTAHVYNPALSHGLLAMYNLDDCSDIEGKALTRRVRGFFYIDDRMDLFLKGISAMFSGEVWISRQILLKYAMRSDLASGKEAPNKGKLSVREREILLLVSNGKTNEELSEKLYISINTVRTHMYHIFKKLGVSNRLQAAIWAAKNL
jgi:DNA-binding NarL/FixJ family response regulator